ncbi:hypothetical protein MKX03_007517, partial [Papaver bracteatum]
ELSEFKKLSSESNFLSFLLRLILSEWLVDVVLPVPLTVAVDASPLLRKTSREDASAETAHVPTASVNEENDEDS